ncbi:flavin monoamine oxidase family protein [Solimonas sp. C16B3]|uniref:Tryptophan 2-monooxygenase n=1 Tax=Solimonas marina TaxID=2714601 RepID=A0A969W9U7_9GAMM|nr:flavin monoamine oxidase family protein [Solimonas marina]NKF23007.1 flavin monoamine oxidase family protein [Solimonas marina]
MTRRELFKMIGMAAGGAAMYQAMSTLGYAAESPFKGPIDLSGAPKGASVLILGSGVAGMTAAYELRNAGYKVQILEYNNRPGGRNWSIRGGDSYTELGGYTQHCEFDKGLYINPGPWRIPYHHRGLLHYCKILGVPIEAFFQINYNAYLHSSKAFGGKPQRYREIKADYQGHVAELLSKATRQHSLDDAISKEDAEKLLESLRSWGALDKDFKYGKNLTSSERRGYEKDPGGGLTAVPIPSQPMGLSDVLDSGLWQGIPSGDNYDMQTALFQPVGGMGRIGEAFGRELGSVIRYNSKVTKIEQSERGVTATYVDTATGATHSASADWCLCTIPLPVLAQIPMNVGQKMAAAISAVPYASAIKVGLQFKRRFWEEDDHIYGGISYTDLPITNIGYPNCDYHSPGKGVLLGAYIWGLNAMEFTAMTPPERVMKAVEYGSQIHPQYKQEFDNGVAVAWHRSPFTMGCYGMWSSDARAKHYEDLCRIDGRIALAGEHASYLGGWQEGGVTSALDAIGRIHQRAVAQGSKA